MSLKKVHPPPAIFCTWAFTHHDVPAYSKEAGPFSNQLKKDV
ncbi:hypothetical protein N288_24255 [Bacillus infantis NRRL B-14911]|uniref:Uncharacterized protein n=1 Tax=Bacillus infantis NRRL B-14911 TaxID=1367477 RepID=U5LJ41_9BACI|nr:hypothetical protein N288_24255 [Bacillus infantis NRRL B-14911]